MRGQAAHKSGEVADGVIGARTIDPTRRITADSFRTLMAKLGSRPAALPPSEPLEFVPQPVVELLPEPSAGFDWTSLLTPAEPVAELREEEPEEQVEAPVTWGDVEEPDPPEPAFPAAGIFEPEELAGEAVEESPAGTAETAEIAVEPMPAEPPLPVITIDLDAALHSVELDQSELVDSISERLGTSATLLRRPGTAADPFARPVPEFKEHRHLDLVEPDPGTEDVGRSLLAIMSAPSGASQPQERALAADTLLRLAPRLATRTLIMIAERVSVMDNPPPMLVGYLLRDPRDEVARPLLERASLVSDQDLMGVIAEGNAAKQRMIARRRVISAALADALIATGEASAMMNLVRNPGAALSQDAFSRLCVLARDHPAFQAPLATRADTPPPIAFELFWVASPDLRRLVLSRFLTDTETLSRILKLTLTVDGEGTAEAKLPPKQKIEEFVDFLESGRDEDAARLLCEIGSISEATARRILADRQGEPLAVMLKALGLPRGRLPGILERLQVCAPPRIARDRALGELQAIFDTLSLTKTRVLLTYWDWAGQTSGPHARLAS